MTIRNNTFNVRTKGRTWWKYAPAIYFYPVTKGANLPDTNNPVHKNILIENNTFFMDVDSVLRAESVDNLKFINNKIYRFNPNISLKANISETEMGVNQTLKLNVEKSGDVIKVLESLPGGPGNNEGSQSNVLEFKKSNNVVIEGNQYDDGLKKNILIEGMTENNYSLKDDLKVLNSRQKLSPDEAVGKINYVSTNPDVAQIDADGMVTAISKGKTDIYAYYICNGRIIKSNIKTINVADKKSNKLGLDKYVYYVGEEKPYLVVFKDDEWLKQSQFTLSVEENEYFDIKDNKFTVKKAGMQKVKITIDGVTEDIYVISYKPVEEIKNADFINVENPTDTLKITEDQIAFQRRGNGEDLWGGTNKLSNLVKLSLDGVNKDNFTASIRFSDLPLRMQGNWDSVYFSLMKLKDDGTADKDNYLSVGKRAHGNGFCVVVERNGNGNELATEKSEENSIRDAKFIIEKQGKIVKLYSDVNG
ncbi:Ig-like domain-containing protein [Helcococcus kunzii]|uniref:Ig-like domain-containing protein n=1 Tax=Helcococcus kunzii TaxID=40091 RepID=UPI0038A13CAD